MTERVNVFLLEEANRQEFIDSHSHSITVVESPHPEDIVVDVDSEYLETLYADPLVESVEPQAVTCSVYPPYPYKQFQQGNLIVGDDKDLRSLPGIKEFFTANNIRPGFPGDIPADTKKNYLGTHFMNWGLYVNSDAAGRNRLESTLSTRQPYGGHPDDLGGFSQEDGHTDNSSVSNPGGTMYTARFFGKDVDIIPLEGSAPWDFDSFMDQEPDSLFHESNAQKYRQVNTFHSVYHPDFAVPVESDGGSILPNRDTNNPTFPEGYYNIPGTRIHLRDWGERNSLLSRYNNTSQPTYKRTVLTQHCQGTASASIGLVGGFAKKAKFWPFYNNSGASTESNIQTIINWHKTKPRNPNIKYGSGSNLTQGVRNPTILVLEIQFVKPHNFFPVDNIVELKHKGVVTNRPNGGWGSNLQPFVDMGLIPFKLQDPETSEWLWTIKCGPGIDGVNNKLKKKLEAAWDAGIFVVTPAGNQCETFAKRDDVEYNSSFVVDSQNRTYYVPKFRTAAKSDFATMKVIDRYEKKARNKRTRRIYPFRQWSPSGLLRDKSFEVAAGQTSESHPILDGYSGRGPGIDIIGDGAGTFTSYPITEFAIDTRLGSGLDLDPSSSMYDNTTYPFSAGDIVRIENLGTGGPNTQYYWEQYAGFRPIIDSEYKVGHVFTMPANVSVNVPPGAKVTDPGWHYGYYSGTSCAGPTVAGKAACIMEEFLHYRDRWPTPNELKDLVLSHGKVTNSEAPSTYWKNAPPASSGPLRSTRDSKHHHDYNNNIGTGVNAFQTLTGTVRPDFTGWKALNTASTTLDSSSIGSIQSSIDTTLYPIRNISTFNTSPADSSLHRVVLTFAYKDDNGNIIKYPFKNGQAVQINGLVGEATELNGNTYYLKYKYSNSFYLFTDADLTTAVNPANVTLASGNVTPSGSIGYSTTITAATSVFTSGGNPKVINIGDELTVSGSTAGLNAGTYYISDVNTTSTPNTLTLKSSVTPLETNAGDSQPITDFTGSTFSLAQIKNNPTTRAHGVSVKLENDATQPGPAGIEGELVAEDGAQYKIQIEADNALAIQLTRVRDNQTIKDLDPILLSGTLNPGKALTAVTHVATTLEGNLTTALFWDQLKTAAFDFDGNGTADALTDGLLLLRYLFGVRGEQLKLGAIGDGATRTAEEIEQVLETTKAIQDIDGNGRLDGLTDGLLLLRYLFNLKGDALVSGAIGPGATRTLSEEIVEYIEKLIPSDNDVTTYGYRDSANSGVIHNTTPKFTSYSSDLTSIQGWTLGFNSHPLLDSFDNKVSFEMFDKDKYFRGSTDELIGLNAVNWRWLQENGGTWGTTKMGSITTSGENGTFTKGGKSYIIRDLWWSEGQKDWHHPAGPQTNEFLNPRTSNGILCFSLENLTDNTIPLNTDELFSSLDINTRSFARADAFYLSDSHGKTVWYWHISTAPFEGSDYQALGKELTSFALNEGAVEETNQFTFTPDSSNDVETYKLKLSNLQTQNGYTNNIKSVSLVRLDTTAATELCRAWASSSQDFSFQSYATTDLAGTPPLRATYATKRHEMFEVYKFPQNYAKSSAIPISAKPGIYPSSDTVVAGSNDPTSLELGAESTVYGWNRVESDNNITPIEEVTTLEEGDTEGAVHEYFPHQLVTADPSTILLTPQSNIEINGSLAVPSVPNIGTFTVGPVNATIDTEEEIRFRWQRSATSGSGSWLDIPADSTTWIGAHTPTLRVSTDNPNHDPIGEYYRCKVDTETTPLEPRFTNTVQAQASLATTFYLWVDTDTATNGFVSAASQAPNAGQISENPAFSSNVDGTNDGPVSIGNNNINIVGIDGVGNFKLQGVSVQQALSLNQSFTLNFIKGVNSDGTGGTPGGSISTADAAYNSYGSLVGWTWTSANIPSEVSSTFNSTSDNPVKVQVILN